MQCFDAIFKALKEGGIVTHVEMYSTIFGAVTIRNLSDLTDIKCNLNFTDKVFGHIR